MTVPTPLKVEPAGPVFAQAMASRLRWLDDVQTEVVSHYDGDGRYVERFRATGRVPLVGIEPHEHWLRADGASPVEVVRNMESIAMPAVVNAAAFNAGII